MFFMLQYLEAFKVKRPWKRQRCLVWDFWWHALPGSATVFIQV